MAGVVVRLERPEDRDAVGALVERAFGRPDEARLVDALCATNAPAFALVAELGGRLVGHALVTRVRVGAKDEAAALGPVSVLPAAQVRGVGAALVETALAKCRGEGRALVVVLGPARYWTRFGFRPARALGLDPPRGDVADDGWLALPLAGDFPRGRVAYDASFGFPA